MRPTIFFLLLTTIITSCSQTQKEAKKEPTQLDFSVEEILVANDYLNRVYDKEIEYHACLKDEKEIQLLLRTLNERTELAEDRLIERLENKNQRLELVKSCEKSCTCEIIFDFLRENQSVLEKDEKKILERGVVRKNKCLNFTKESFCQSPLYQKINTEKEDFIFEEND